MKTLTITDARKHIKTIVDSVHHRGEVIGIGRRHSVDVLVIPFSSGYTKDLNDITNINTYSRSFDFLANEPEVYSLADLKKKYV